MMTMSDVVKRFIITDQSREVLKEIALAIEAHGVHGITRLASPMTIEDVVIAGADQLLCLLTHTDLPHHELGFLQGFAQAVRHRAPIARSLGEKVVRRAT